MEASEYWHVRVEARDAPPGSEIVVLDQTRDWIEQRVLEPRRRGEAIALQGHELAWADIEYIRITRSQVPSEQLIAQVRAEDQASSVAFIGGPSYRWEAAAKAEDMTDKLITGPVGSASSESDQDESEAADPRKVMVVHGRDEEARRAMFDFLKAIGLLPQEWSELVAATGSGAPYIGEVLENAFQIAKAVVVLFTPDDEAYLREEFQSPHDPPEEREPTPQARPNVLFEAGMALGVHPKRTILVELGKLRPFSDIYGRHVVRLDHTPKSLLDIAKRLETAGCAVDLSGGEWANASFPNRAASSPKAGNPAARSLTGQLDVGLQVLDGEPLVRADLSERALDEFLWQRKQSLLGSLPEAVGGTRSVFPLTTVTHDYRSPEQFREEVDEHLSKVREALPDVLTARSVLHDVGRVQLGVVNEKDHSWTNVRVELSVPKGVIVDVWKPEQEQEKHELPEPPSPFGTSSVGQRRFAAFGKVHFPEAIPFWVPEIEESASETKVIFREQDVRAEGTAPLRDIWLLADDQTPEKIVINWEATADNATKRLKGTIEIAVSDQYVTPEQLLEKPPD